MNFFEQLAIRSEFTSDDTPKTPGKPALEIVEETIETGLSDPSPWITPVTPKSNENKNNQTENQTVSSQSNNDSEQPTNPEPINLSSPTQQKPDNLVSPIKNSTLSDIETSKYSAEDSRPAEDADSTQKSTSPEAALQAVFNWIATGESQNSKESQRIDNLLQPHSISSPELGIEPPASKDPTDSINTESKPTLQQAPSPNLKKTSAEVTN